MFFLTADAATYSDLGSLGFFMNLGVLGIITILWITKKIGVIDHDERDYLRQENKELKSQLNDLHESVRKEIVPTYTQIAQLLPVLIDRITK